MVNTWHFRTIGATTNTEACDDIETTLQTFYSAIDQLMAIYLGTPASLKYYDLSDAEPRVPIREDPITIVTGSGTAFPGEVAIALSYRGANVSGESAARRRGRIFLGPLVVGVAENASSDMVVTAAARTTISNAAVAVADRVTAGNIAWVVFSPTTAGPPPWSGATLLSSSFDVVAGHVDNAFDTIRSRGATTTARTNWSATIP